MWQHLTKATLIQCNTGEKTKYLLHWLHIHSNKSWLMTQSQIAQNPRPARKINIRTSVQNASASINVQKCLQIAGRLKMLVFDEISDTSKHCKYDWKMTVGCGKRWITSLIWFVLMLWWKPIGLTSWFTMHLSVPLAPSKYLTIMYRKRYKMHTIGAKLEQDKMYALRMTFLPNFRRFPLSFDSNFIVLFSFMDLLSMKMAFIIDRMSHTFRLWNEWIDEHPKQTCTNPLLASCGDFGLGLGLAYISTEYSTHFKWTSVYKYTNMMHTNK